MFLPLEHTVLAQAADPQQRTALFARYSLAGALTGAVGTLAASLPDLAVKHSGMSHLAAMQAMFWLYGLTGAWPFCSMSLSPRQSKRRPKRLRRRSGNRAASSTASRPCSA